MGFFNQVLQVIFIINCVNQCSVEAMATMPSMDNFVVALTTTPSSPMSKVPTTLSFSIEESGTRKAWNQLQISSGRRLHVVIVSENLNMLGHIHPEDFMNGVELDGSLSTFTVNFTFPWPGLYGVAMEFEPMGGSSAIKRRFNLTVSGTGTSTALPTSTTSLTRTVKSLPLGTYQDYILPIIISDTQDLSSGSTVNTYTVGLKTSPTTLKSMGCSQMIVSFANATTKSDMMDMTTYLDHPMHVIVVAHGLGFIDHIHGDVSSMAMRGRELMSSTASSTCGSDEMSSMTMDSRFGPSLQVLNNFTNPGTYTLYFEAANQNHTQLLVSTFSLTVEDGGMSNGALTQKPLIVTVSGFLAVAVLTLLVF